MYRDSASNTDITVARISAGSGQLVQMLSSLYCCLRAASKNSMCCVFRKATLLQAILYALGGRTFLHDDVFADIRRSFH